MNRDASNAAECYFVAIVACYLAACCLGDKAGSLSMKADLQLKGAQNEAELCESGKHSLQTKYYYYYRMYSLFWSTFAVEPAR